MHTLVTVSMQELDRLKCIEAVVDGSLKPIRAAERLDLTSRQVRRLAKRYRVEGPIGLVSRRRNQPSNNRLHSGLELGGSGFEDFARVVSGFRANFGC
jgi:hypothetical protein